MQVTVAYGEAIDVDDRILQTGIAKQTGQRLSVHHRMETRRCFAGRPIHREQCSTKNGKTFTADDGSDQDSARRKHLPKDECGKFWIVAVIQ